MSNPTIPSPTDIFVSEVAGNYLVQPATAKGVQFVKDNLPDDESTTLKGTWIVENGQIHSLLKKVEAAGLRIRK